MSKRIKHGIQNVLRILIWSTVFFGVLKELIACIHSDVYVPSLREILYFITFNKNPFGGHLWYLGAYLYVLVIVYFVDKYKKWNYIFAFIPILLIGDLVLGKYSLLLFNKEFDYIFVRNFLFVGLPYFALSAYLKTKEIRLCRINKIYYLGGAALFFLTSILERYILISLDKNPVRDHYMSTTFLAVCLFLFIISLQQNKPSFISNLGERDSLYIYVFHPFFILYVFPFILIYLPFIWTEIYNSFAPLFILVATVVFTNVLRLIKIVK